MDLDSHLTTTQAQDLKDTGRETVGIFTSVSVTLKPDSFPSTNKLLALCQGL